MPDQHGSNPQSTDPEPAQNVVETLHHHPPPVFWGDTEHIRPTMLRFAYDNGIPYTEFPMARASRESVKHFYDATANLPTCILFTDIHRASPEAAAMLQELVTSVVPGPRFIAISCISDHDAACSIPQTLLAKMLHLTFGPDGITAGPPDHVATPVA